MAHISDDSLISSFLVLWFAFSITQWKSAENPFFTTLLLSKEPKTGRPRNKAKLQHDDNSLDTRTHTLHSSP